MSLLPRAPAFRPRGGLAIVRTAFVSTYPPRRSPLATFTHDLALATGNREVVALDESHQTGAYQIEVHHRIRSDEPADYERIARALDACVDVVSIQHEYGIWGGPDGARVLDFVAALDRPAVATLHTILADPSPGERAVLSELIARCDATVVMSRSAAALLGAVYGVDPQRVDVVPHGVPDIPIMDAEPLKASLGMAGRSVILSFGLLAPGKGYELVLDALPGVVARHPDACYVIVGATHPNVLRSEGEDYRSRLASQAERLGMTGHVRFVDRFLGRNELIRWLEAADVFVTPDLALDKAVSGSLAYAMSAGRAIVSTPYAYAAELLDEERGLLVPAGSAGAFTEALNRLLDDDELRTTLGGRAHAHSRPMVWSAVGADYRRVLERVALPTPRPDAASASLAVIGA